MNINSRIFKCSIFLTLLISTLSCANFLEISKNLKKNSEELISFELADRSLVIGEYSLNNKLDYLELLDSNKKFLRKLNSEKKLKSKFYFVSKKSGKYYFKIKNKSKENSINLVIKKVLKHEDTIIKKEKIISPFFKSYIKKIEENKSTNYFWEEVKKRGTPLIEHLKEDTYILTFFYRAANFNVKLLGGPISDSKNLYRFKDTDIWYRSFLVKRGIRMSYQLAVDVPNIKGSYFEKRMAMISNAQKDPLNLNPYIYSKEKNLNKYETLSTFEIPKKDFYDWGVENGNKKGIIKNYKFNSIILKNQRDIAIYVPFNFDYKKEHDLLFVFDGKNYQNKIDTPIILDNLIAKNKINPTIAVFISNSSRETRSKELPPNNEFATFMAKELLPFVKKQLKFNHKASNTILAGASYGGIASAYIALQYPHLFGKVLSQSGSFWWSPKNDNEPEWLTRQFAKKKKENIKFYLNAGTYETGFLPLDILETNRHFRIVLESKKYDYTYEEFIGGHDYFSWKIYLANGLISLNKK